MSDDKLRRAVAELVRIMVPRRHSDLCQQGGDCEVCEAMCDINAALADSADAPPEVTEKMVGVTFNILANLMPDSLTSPTRVRHHIKDALCAALAAAQKEGKYPLNEEGCR